MEGRSSPRPFERRDKSVYLGKFFIRNLRDMLKRPCKQAALSIGVLPGNLEGVRLLGFLREKKEIGYLGSFFLDPEDIESQIWGPSGTLARNRALLS